MSHSDSFDYIVIGAGTAGCVMASRLSEDPEISVLLIEAGPADVEPDIHMPAAFPRLNADERIGWSYRSDAEPWLNGRKIALSKARVVGGATSINSMDFVRATAHDFDQWAQSMQDPQWSYLHLLPYFKRSESHTSIRNAYRGNAGPVQLTQGSCQHPLHKAFLEAGQQAGYPLTDDLNGHQQEGVGPLDMMIDKGQRCSVASAYLKPAADRPNLQIELNARVTQVQCANGRAVGVDYHRDDWTYRASARQEVIVCAGAINSPQLLQRSGIGESADLTPLGIDMVAHSPGVGQHLQDQLVIAVQTMCKHPISLSAALSMLGKTRARAQWALTKTGPWASSHYESGALLRTRDNAPCADVYCRFLPLAMDQNGQLARDGHSYQVQASYLRPTSAGYVKLRSLDPYQAPRIVMDYLSTETDRAAMRRIVEQVRHLLAQSAFARYRGEEIAPGADADTASELDVFIRENAVSGASACGTCRMGRDDLAVVDEQLRVNGVEGLRVVDASVLPAMVSGSISTTSIVVAEKAADMILGRSPLPAASVSVATNNPLPVSDVA